MSIYKLAKVSGIAYATLNDICNEKVQIEKCSAETIYKIAKALDVSMESIISPYVEKRVDFEIYKSNVCHRLKELGDEAFLIEILESDSIRMYYEKKWYPECLYMLAMLDYISRINDIPYCDLYDDLRVMKLQKTLYPSSVMLASKIRRDQTILERTIDESIPEFIRFNIVESEVRNVI